jgi:hypothetical protein
MKAADQRVREAFGSRQQRYDENMRLCSITSRYARR